MLHASGLPAGEMVAPGQDQQDVELVLVEVLTVCKSRSSGWPC